MRLPALIALAALACRAPSSPPQPWHQLLDGRWSATSFGGEGEVRVEGGALELDMGQPLTGVTWHEPIPSGDYELELLATRLAGDDFFVGLTFPVGEAHLTLVLGGWGGALCGLSCLDGEDASGNETKFFRAFEKGRETHVRLEVVAGRVRCWIDDENVIDLDTTDRELSLRTEVELNAPLGIATFLTRSSYRDLRWRSL